MRSMKNVYFALAVSILAYDIDSLTLGESREVEGINK